MVHKAFLGMSRAMALAGGAVLVALILLVCVSITGRALNGLLHSDVLEGAGWAKALLDVGIGPVTGDFELVEAGMAFAIFAFLPLCQITGAHASVDVFSDRLPRRVLLVLKAFIEVLFAVVLIIIARQLFEGTGSKIRSGQTTFLIQFPVWWAYAASFAASALAALVAVYVAGLRLQAAVTGRAGPLDEVAET